MHRQSPITQLLALAGLTLWSAACPGNAGTASNGDAGNQADAGSPFVDDPDPVFTAAQTLALFTLAPSSLPPPPVDPTNYYADSDAAAKLGQKLFFDPGFSGPLTDHDNCEPGSPGCSADSLGAPPDTGRVACASCHDPAKGFSDWRSFELSISLGAGWGRRRAPSLLDVGQAQLLMWDGRRDALWNQVFGPIENFVEMNSSRLFYAEQLYSRYQADYVAVFGLFPNLVGSLPPLTASQTGCYPTVDTSSLTCNAHTYGVPGDTLVYEPLSPSAKQQINQVVVNAGKAIAAYERKLSCGPGAFDAWAHGAAGMLSRSAQRGAALFVGKAQCVLCHSGPYLSDQQFHNVGLFPGPVQEGFVDADDHGARDGLTAVLTDPLNTKGAFSDKSGGDGRLPAAVSPAMDGAFRTPTLRCLSRRPKYMHTGQLRDLASVVDFFNQGGGAGSPGPQLIGRNELNVLGLSSREQADLVAFLQALEGPGPDPTLLVKPQ